MSNLNWESVSKTDMGTVRKVNEDSYFSSIPEGVFCVADGMGGHARGDVASQLITSQLSALIESSKTTTNLVEIKRCIEDVNRQLIHLSETHNSIVGSTVVILLIEAEKIHCIWAGDSRIYRLRNSEMTRLTRDHSQVEDMIDAGIISAAEAETHPKANIITRAVGAHKILELDCITYDLRKNDKFVLCSDGLNKVMNDQEIQNHVQYQSFENIADAFIDIALERNARDNVTVTVVQHINYSEMLLKQTLPLDATLPLKSYRN